MSNDIASVLMVVIVFGATLGIFHFSYDMDIKSQHTVREEIPVDY